MTLEKKNAMLRKVSDELRKLVIGEPDRTLLSCLGYVQKVWMLICQHLLRPLKLLVFPQHQGFHRSRRYVPILS